MFDAALRRRCAPWIESPARSLNRRGLSADAATVLGLLIGLSSAAAAATGWWITALVLWLISRVFDGFDGAIARVDGATVRGGFIDIVADFSVYAAFVAGVAIERPEARLAAVITIGAYYVSGAAFLAWSSLTARDRAERATAGIEIDDDRSLRFVGGIAEGFETMVVYSIICLLPHRAELLLWVFAALVGFTAAQRIVFAVQNLSGEPGSART